MRLRAFATAAIALVALLAWSCVDLTHRDRTPDIEITGTPSNFDTGPDPRDSPDELTMPLGTPNPSTGAASVNMNTAYKFATYVTAVASGTVTKTIQYPAASWYATNPSGSFTYQANEIVLSRYDGTMNYRTVDFLTSTTKTFLMEGGYSAIIGAARPGHGNGSYYGDNNAFTPDGLPRVYCGVEYGTQCFTYTGGPSQVVLTRLTADMTVTPEKPYALPGETPYVDYRASPLNFTIDGASKGVPFVVDSTHWIPDADSLGGDGAETATHAANTGACQPVGTGCRRKIIGSGTFVMNAFVNGKRLTKTAHIAAPDLILTASPDTVLFGDTVRFTPNWTDGTAITSGVLWTWMPNTSPGATPACGSVVICKVPLRESGTMKITITRNGVVRTAFAKAAMRNRFSLTATPTQVTVGRVVRFTATLNDQPTTVARWRWTPSVASGDTLANCVGGVMKCYRIMHGSGTMWAYLSASGGDSASASVSVLNPEDCSSARRTNGLRATMSCIPGEDPVDPIAAEMDPLASELANLSDANPFAFLRNDTCAQMPDWSALASHKIPAEVSNRLRTEPALSNTFGTSFIQTIDSAKGPVVNLDYYAVTAPITSIPNGMSVEGYLNYIRTHINDFVDKAKFNFYPGLADEDLRWLNSPLGTVFSIELFPKLGWFSPEDGSVVATAYSTNHWIFSTAWTPADFRHPVSGNRRFGAIDNGDGTATFYTRGTDRISTNSNRFLDWLPLINIFESGNAVWVDLQNHLKAQLGSSAQLKTVIYRVNYDQVSKVLSGAAPVSSLAVCGAP